jgi:shikimate kinase
MIRDDPMVVPLEEGRSTQDGSSANGVLANRWQLGLKVCLIGFQGSGKTTVGRWLSSKLVLPFFDTDQSIATKHRCSSAKQAFVTLGEDRFREEECICVESLLKLPSYVLSLGGGAVQALKLIPKGVHVIYLFRHLKEIESDIVKQVPCWIDAAAPSASLKERWKERNPVYFHSATGVVLVEKQSVEDDGNKVLQMVGRNG